MQNETSQHSVLADLRMGWHKKGLISEWKEVVGLSQPLPTKSSQGGRQRFGTKLSFGQDALEKEGPLPLSSAAEAVLCMCVCVSHESPKARASWDPGCVHATYLVKLLPYLNRFVAFVYDL